MHSRASHVWFCNWVNDSVTKGCGVSLRSSSLKHISSGNLKVKQYIACREEINKDSCKSYKYVKQLQFIYTDHAKH